MGRFGERVGSVEALAWAFLLSVVIALAALLVARRGLGGPRRRVVGAEVALARSLLGTFIVFTITLVSPRIGTTATIALLVAGQLGAGTGDRPVRPVRLRAHRAQLAARARDRAARGGRGAHAEAVTPRAWAALWAVYLIWGSTYLGIKVAGDTIPAFFAVSSRFVIAGHADGGDGSHGGAGGERCGSPAGSSRRAALIGLLLPGANGILFVAERTVPTGVASLIIASVPLLVVLLRLAGGDRPPTLAIAGVLVGFAGVALLFHPEGGATWWGIALTGSPRSPGRPARTSPPHPAPAGRVRRERRSRCSRAGSSCSRSASRSGPTRPSSPRSRSSPSRISSSSDRSSASPRTSGCSTTSRSGRSRRTPT